MRYLWFSHCREVCVMCVVCVCACTYVAPQLADDDVSEGFCKEV